ncbi:hypothetical protein JM79_2119 [Gramella sp. Hel_I_59]|uniref:hypothetical protein n=1 Tax=Gramella sp. Hel_I_59 TaxID=1249978 RepID=UPI00114D7D02|nr:hypothetical protein [Gramella sp. Hel_I_59]TQI71192.1 hypothetical protein JM79_2119 [Gramella sp. Hel_I_59]
MHYRVKIYRTIFGEVEEITLPDSTYGEWMLYENNEVIFHVNLSNYKSKSDCLINILISINELNLEDIIADINERFQIKLRLFSKPRFSIKINSKSKDLDVGSLPFEWIEKYTELIKPPWEKYPNISPDKTFWINGKGALTESTFKKYYNSLDQNEKNNFQLKFKPTLEWLSFYE